mgnify:CR=1 FL=1
MKARAMRLIALLDIRAAGQRGLTSDDVAALNGLPANTVSPRISELRHHYRVIARNGERRRTRTGRWAHVLTAIAQPSRQRRLFG